MAFPMPVEKNFKYLLCIIFIAFVIRALFAVSLYIVDIDADYNTHDSKEYISLAQELVRHGRFQSTFPILGARTNTPEIQRTPGYPLFLVPGILLGHVQPVTIFLQIMLSCLTIYYIYRVCFFLFEKEKPALVAACIFAFDPMSVFFTSCLLTETLSAFLIILLALSLLKYSCRGLVKHLVAAAFLCSASMFVRPNCYYLPFFLAIAILTYRLIKGTAGKRFMTHILVFLCCAMAPALAWQVRNYLAAGYSGFSTVSAVTLYYYNSVAVLAQQRHISYTDLQRGMLNLEDYFAQHPEQRSWTEVQRYDYMAKEGFKVIRDNLFSYGVIHLKAMFRFMFDPGIVKYFKLFRYQSANYEFLEAFVGRGFLGTVKMIYYQKRAMFFLYAIAGIFLGSVIFCACTAFLSKSMQFNLPVYLLLIMIAYFWVLTGIHDCPRFRTPIMPLIAVFSGIGACALKVTATSIYFRFRGYPDRPSSH